MLKYNSFNSVVAVTWASLLQDQTTRSVVSFYLVIIHIPSKLNASVAVNTLVFIHYLLLAQFDCHHTIGFGHPSEQTLFFWHNLFQVLKLSPEKENEFLEFHRFIYRRHFVGALFTVLKGQLLNILTSFSKLCISELFSTFDFFFVKVYNEKESLSPKKKKKCSHACTLILFCTNAHQKCSVMNVIFFLILFFFFILFHFALLIFFNLQAHCLWGLKLEGWNKQVHSCAIYPPALITVISISTLTGILKAHNWGVM